MIPVDQTKFGKGEGNCYQACLASILHLSIDEIPQFDEAEERGGYWLTAANRWANERGLHIIVVREIDWVSWSRYPGYYICGGPAERGLGHACVYHKGELAHDPHPSRAGLIKVEEWQIIVPCEIAT